MTKNHCSNCDTPLPLSLSSNEVSCATCGKINFLSLVAEDARKPEKTKIEVKPKSISRKIVNFIFVIVGVIYLSFWCAKQLGYDLKEYFYLYITIPHEVDISPKQIHNFSEVGVTRLVERFKKHLDGRQWLNSVSGRSKLNAYQIQKCIKIDIYFKDKIGLWAINFSCFTDFKYTSDADNIAKELENRFRKFLKANK